MAKHAFLSASASHRWLSCPPSAKLCAEQENQVSPYAKEGTDAHSLCEYKVEITTTKWRTVLKATAPM